MSEVFLANPITDTSALPIVTDTQFAEPNQSATINRKFKGILPAGIYSGFELSINNAATGEIEVRKGSALVEVDNKYLLTVQVQQAHTVTVANDKAYLVVLEAFYKYGTKTAQVDASATQKAAQFKVIEQADKTDNQIVIARVDWTGKATLSLNDVIQSSPVSMETKLFYHSKTGVLEDGTNYDKTLLVAPFINVFPDDGEYKLPPAASVPKDKFIEIDILEKYKHLVPTLLLQNGDVLELTKGGTESEGVRFDSGRAYSIRLYSNGIDKWSV